MHLMLYLIQVLMLVKVVFLASVVTFNTLNLA